MRQGTIRVLMLALALILGGAVMAGGVWVSDSGETHSVGANAIFLDEDGDSFDLSDLEDGETRTFGSGDEQLVATRNGDVVKLERPASADEKAIEIICKLGSDSCEVLTFGDDSEKTAIMIKKTRGGHHGSVVTIDEDIISHGDSEATIVIQQLGDCGHHADADCAEKMIKVMAGAGHTGQATVEVITSDDDGAHRDVWVHGGPHRHHAMLMADGVTAHDLSELLEGETRIYGYGEKQVTVLREGDEVTISREATADDDEMSVTCTVGRDNCKVLTFDDDPEKVAIMIEKTRRCVDGEGDCDAALLHLELGEGDGDFKVIRLKGGDDD